MSDTNTESLNDTEFDMDVVKELLKKVCTNRINNVPKMGGDNVVSLRTKTLVMNNKEYMMLRKILDTP